MDRHFDIIVGHTPIIQIFYRYKGEARSVFCKYETFNMTGSIKDRMALYIITRSYELGILKPGDTIAEATSGNTGISFSAIGRALGHRVIIFMPDWMSEERKRLIASFGAEVRLVSKEEGGFLGSIAMSRQYAEDNAHVFLPMQFDNPLNAEAHMRTTGPEIRRQLGSLGLVPDVFVAGVGTGGTVMGVGAYLREWNPGVRVHPLEPANSPTLSTGHKVGKHRIQGISDEFIPSIVDLGSLDRVVQVDDGDAILMGQKFARELGLGLGISSGANFLGAVMAQDALDGQATAVTIFCDSNKKYLSTDLIKNEPVKDGFLSPEIELTHFKLLRCAEVQ
ncbi:MAG: cysteine synthase family protein [Bacteroidetes bacterium]|nr:cysteine synthase family protein [Bacteroidota bacterium]